jgi:hypothetical protein
VLYTRDGSCLHCDAQGVQGIPWSDDCIRAYGCTQQDVSLQSTCQGARAQVQVRQVQRSGAWQTATVRACYSRAPAVDAAVGAGFLCEVVLLPQLLPEASSKAAGGKLATPKVQAARTAASLKAQIACQKLILRVSALAHLQTTQGSGLVRSS